MVVRRPRLIMVVRRPRLAKRSGFIYGCEYFGSVRRPPRNGGEMSPSRQAARLFFMDVNIYGGEISSSRKAGIGVRDVPISQSRQAF